jgi:hypothetical protein
MIIFSSGIVLTANENSTLLHIVSDPEAWLMAIITEKARLRRDALIAEWRPRLFADPAVTELPADSEALCVLIMARSDYKTRLQQDAAQDPPQSPSRHNIARHAAVDRSGSTVTLFASGINLTDTDTNCILAYIQDLDDWVLGALLGQVNRGKKKMIQQYHPIIMDDPSVTTMPATETGLINMIVARSDYQRLGG